MRARSYGGEEFLIVVPGCGRDALLAGAERIRHSIADRPIASDAASIPTTVSLGVMSAKPRQRYFDYEALLQFADMALYRTKANGRNRLEEAESVEAPSPVMVSARNP